MKKNLNINIGSRVFNIDEDAYDLLSKYLESIKKYFEKINIDEDISNCNLSSPNTTSHC